MKKIVSLALAAVMLLGAVPMVNAAEVTENHDYSNGTAITLVGTGTEEYTVTVPAKMAPGDTGTIKAEGTWAADKFLNVGAPSTVTLTYGAQTMDVAITGGSFSLIGNSVEAVSKEVEISVEDASRLFGTWEGVIVYDVALIQKGDVNGDGVITEADTDVIRELTNKGQDNLTEEDLLLGDWDGNGKINAKDVAYWRALVETNSVVPAPVYTPNSNTTPCTDCHYAVIDGVCTGECSNNS